MTDMSTRSRWLALLVLCLGDLMIVLDVTIVGVALPSIREDLGFSEESLAWVVNGYLITFGGFLLLGGRLGDLFGHRRLFLIGIALFTAASAACGLATTQELLVGARVVQGLGAAVVSAVALSLMMTLFTEPAERAKAMGIFGFVAAGGGSIGVLLGGIITDVLNWHWIFLVNVPVGILVVVLSLMLIPPARVATAAQRLDVAGAVTVTLALMVAVFAIVNGNDVGWLTARTLGLLAVSGVLLAAFLAIEHRVESPLMPLRLFGLRNVAISNVVGVLWAGAMFAWFFLSALYLQLVLGYSPLEVGLAFLPGNLIMGALSIGLSAKLVMRFGIRLPLAVGLSLAGVGARALRPGSGRRELRRRRAPEHDPARPRRRDGVQPGHPRRDGRRGADRGRPRVGLRQHLVHDGRGARARRPGQPRRLADGHPARQRRLAGCRPHGRVPRRFPRRRDLRVRRRGDRRPAPPAARDGGRRDARSRRAGDRAHRRGRVMGTVVLDISTSLDGFVAGPNPTLEQPLGEGGERLHEWIVGLASWREAHGMTGGGARSADDDVVEEGVARTGAVVMGRRMFSGGSGPWQDDPRANGWWGEDPPFRKPVFVLTHHPREPLTLGGTTFTFVTEGIEVALERAREAAGDRDVLLAGGASVAQQALDARLVGEMQLHVAPVLLGGGRRLLDNVSADLRFEPTRVLESPAVTHLRYRVAG